MSQLSVKMAIAIGESPLRLNIPFLYFFIIILVNYRKLSLTKEKASASLVEVFREIGIFVVPSFTQRGMLGKTFQREEGG